MVAGVRSVHWGRWCALAGAVLLTRATSDVVVRGLTVGREEAFARAVEAVTRVEAAA